MDPRDLPPRGLVRVEGRLVVDLGVRVERVPLDLRVETLELLAEVRDVLVRELPDAVELLFLLAVLRPAAEHPPGGEPASPCDQQQQQPLHGVSLEAWTGTERTPPGRQADLRQVRMLTARATIMMAITSEMDDWTSITILAQRVTGNVSVGLRAVELVKAR